MKIASRAAIILAGSVLISGCAPMLSGIMNASVDENTVIEKTAKYFDTNRENLMVSSIDKGALATAYKVKYAGKTYNCTIYYGEVSCKEPGVEKEARVQGAADNAQGMTPKQAQVRLNELGYQVGTPDGIFGKKTVAQLKRFQKSRGLAPSGKLDEATINALH